MATWTDVRAWRHGPMTEAGQSLRSLGTPLADLAQDAQQAGSRIASQAPSVDAARAALSRCGASHEELLAQVGSLTRATTEAGEGVAAVEKKVLAALDFADAHPMVTLHPDGTVSAAPGADSAAGEAASASGASMGAAAGLAGLTAEQIQAQAAELEQMVSATLTLADQVDEAYASTLTALAVPDPQPGPSPSPGQPAPPSPPGAGQPRSNRSQGDRDSALEDSRRGRRYRRGRSHNGGGGGDADNQGDWLGDGVPGEHADMPGIKPWQYQGDSDNEGSGPHAQRSPTPGDYATHEAATAAAWACSSMWPDASANLQHYLGNTGDPQSMDVDKMLEDLPDLSDDANADVTRMAEKAVEKSQETGATGPMTYPFTTAWDDEYATKQEDPNWFYATGGYKAATDGTITVYPPTDENPEWTYKYDYRVHTADRYNWDGTKSTKIVGVPITDKQLQELHRAGLAQEYDLVGESSVQHGEGSP